MLVDTERPFGVDEVTPTWLSTVLASAGVIPADCPVTSIAIDPMSGGHGETGVVVRAALRYHDSGVGRGPDSVILKFATTDPVLRARTAQLGGYRREVDFYRMFAAHTVVRTPAPYWLAVGEDGKRCALVLEDFPRHRAGDETVGCSVEQAGLALTAIAGAHSSLWESPLIENAAAFMRFDRAWLEQGWHTMIQEYGEQLPGWLKAARESYIAAVPELQTWIQSSPRTLIHGDFRLDNLLFAHEGDADPVVLVDWQGAHAAKGVQDVAYLLSHCMETTLRQDHEDQLLRAYYQQLTSSDSGPSSYGWEQFQTEYRKAVLYLFSYVISIAGVMKNDHERAHRRKVALVRRAVASLKDWHCLDLVAL